MLASQFQRIFTTLCNIWFFQSLLLEVLWRTLFDKSIFFPQMLDYNMLMEADYGSSRCRGMVIESH